MSFSCDNEPACKNDADMQVYSQYHGRNFWFCSSCAFSYQEVFEEKKELPGPKWPRADTEPVHLGLGSLFDR